MAVTLTGTGGLFKRIGRLAGGCQDAIAFYGGTATARVLSTASLATRGTNIEADAAESPAVSDQIDGHWSAIENFRSSGSSLFSSFRTVAERVLIRQVDLDAGLPSQDLETALRELIRQMESSSDDVNASSVSAGSQTSVGSPNGDPIIVVSVTNARGQTLQTPFAETLRFDVTADSQAGTATLRQESLRCRGEAAVTDVFSRDWPAGSGANTTLSLIDNQLDNQSAGNLLYNSDFETFSTSNYPDNWVVGTGTVGTHVFAGGSSDDYTGSNCLEITGDGSNLTAVYQKFDTAASTSAGAGGTPAELEPKTQYAAILWSKVSSVPAAGVLRVALVDGSNTVINDDEGTANSFTIDLTAETTSYAAHTGSFRTPSVLPDEMRLMLSLTTALSNTVSLFIDDVGFAEMTQLYAGGPSVAAFAGATKAVIGDSWTVAISNTRGVMADWFERFFALNAKGLVLPYDTGGTETVADSLVT